MDEVDEILVNAERLYVSNDSERLLPKVQMLTDLGYINIDLIFEPLIENQLVTFFNAFYNDFLCSEFAIKIDLPKMEAMYREQFDLKLLEVAIDMDEGLKVTKLPKMGEQNLVTRIIHYRLALIGMYTGPIDLYFNALSYSTLEKAANYVGKSKLETINLLSDFQAYTEAFLVETGYKNSVVVFKAEADIDRTKFPEYRGQFKRQLRDDLADYPDEFERLKENIFFLNDDKVKEDFLLSRESDEINSFMLRLIQIHQWMSGHYNGALDSTYGNKTLESLLEIIDCYKESSSNNIIPEAVFGRVKNDYYIFNSLFFLKNYKEENHSQDKIFDVLDTISDAYQNAKNDDKKRFSTNFQNGIENEKNQTLKIPEKRNGTMRRLFLGIRTFFKKAFRFAKKIFSWIVKGISSFTGNVIRMIYAFLKEAIQHFIAGVKFLLGKLPTITLSHDKKANYSNFDLDKDGINVFGTSNKMEVQAHIKEVWNNIHSMSFSLNVVSLLITAISGANIIGWPFFALKLVAAFKRTIESYKLTLI
ncbi:MAG: hypothetical protein WC384_07550 [Prolixibacteraceae bacterium]|jgi:hypothetical protein